MSSDIAGLIEKLYPKQKLFVLGNGGLGGIIAQTLCIRFENLIDGLILVNSIHPSNNGPSNLYIDKYNNKFMNNAQFKNKIKSSKKSVSIGCVESVTIWTNDKDGDNDDDQKQMEMGKGGEMDDGEDDNDNDDSDDSVAKFFYKDYEDRKNTKFGMGSYVMECQQNKQYPFIFNTINGHIIGSLLNRPKNGILAQQNGFIKLVSTKTNVISSRINEIKPSTLILYGNRDYVIDYKSSEYLAQKLIDVEMKQVNALKDAGHLWWLTHSRQAAGIINEFLFKTERNLLTRYDVIIENIINNDQEKQLNHDEYTIVITSKSFISDKLDEYQQKYEISSSDIQMQYPLYCKFLCIMSHLGKQPLLIKILSKDKRLIGVGQCILTEATNASLIVDIINLDENNDNNDVLFKFV